MTDLTVLEFLRDQANLKGDLKEAAFYSEGSVPRGEHRFSYTLGVPPKP